MITGSNRGHSMWACRISGLLSEAALVEGCRRVEDELRRSPRPKDEAALLSVSTLRASRTGRSVSGVADELFERLESGSRASVDLFLVRLRADLHWFVVRVNRETPADLSAYELATRVLTAYSGPENDAPLEPDPPSIEREAESWGLGPLIGGEDALPMGIPFDHPRGRPEDRSPAIAVRTVDAKALGPVDELARQAGGRRSDVFAAAAACLLGRVLGQDEVGIAVHDPEGHPEAEHGSGDASPAPVVVARYAVGEAASFRHLVRCGAESMIRAGLDRDLVYHGARFDADDGPGLSLCWTRADGALLHANGLRFEWMSTCGSALYCRDDGVSVTMRLHYDGQVIDGRKADVFLVQLETLVIQGAASPGRSVQELSLRADGTATRLPDPGAELDAVSAEHIHARFLECCDRSPTATAIRWSGRDLTYRELDLASNRIGNFLRDRGIGPGNTVGVATSRCPTMIAAILGVVKTGAAFGVLDSAYPEARIREYLRSIEPEFLVACGGGGLSAETAEQFSLSDRTLVLPADAAEVASVLHGVGDHRPGVEFSPDEVAYVTFTSGSTGTPKCIETAHAPLPHFVRWQSGHFGLKGSDRFSMLSGLGHDPVLRDIFTPLSIGATVCIPPEGIHFEPGRLLAWLISEGISVAHLTPAMGEFVIAGGQGGEGSQSMRLMFWGGDVLEPQVIDQMRRVFPGATHVNFYGATETPQAMSFHEVAESDPPVRTYPVGRGIDDVQILVMGPREPCGVGEIGEICIRTRYLSRGYRNDPEQTRARFTINPFGSSPDDRIYRTGDLGRYDVDGRVTHAGRLDAQVKIRGFRVEPSEVAAKIREVPGVQAALVVARQVRTGARALVAYFVPDASGSLQPGAIREHLRVSLPDYMQPAFFKQLSEFPLLPNGKIDRMALPEPGAEDAPASSGTRPPTTEREKTLAVIWEECLGVPVASVTDSFFDLGGDSLTALRAAVKMRSRGIDEVIARGIFQGLTIEQLADSGAGGAPATSSPQAVRTEVINCLRGILIFLVVVAHWLPALHKRLPAAAQRLLDMLAPVFDLATPGFAITFGISIGYVYVRQFERDPRRTNGLLRLGAYILLAAILLQVAIRVAWMLIGSEPITSTDFFDTFYSALLYYFVALLTVPLWLKAVANTRRQVLVCFVLALLSFGVYQVLFALLYTKEFVGVVQLMKLLLCAKFNYFNLSAGALVGLGIGIQLRRSIGDERVTNRYFLIGIALVVIGMLMSIPAGGVEVWYQVARQIAAWKWIAHLGVVLFLVAALSWILDRGTALGRIRRTPLQLLAVFGQCSLPVWILHHFVSDIKDFLDLLGMSDALALAIAMGVFFGVTGLIMRRLYVLYYGSLITSSSPSSSSAAR